MQRTDTDLARFAKALAVLNAIFGNGKPMSKQVVEAYYLVLRGYDTEAIEAAVGRLLRTRTRHEMPTPAEILEAVEGRVKDRAVLAWAAVERALKSSAVYQGVRFSDPAIHSAIDMLGGWQVLCSATTYDMPRLRADFIRMYEIASRRNGHDEHPDVVQGLLEGTPDDPVDIDLGYDRMASERPSQIERKRPPTIVPSKHSGNL